MRVGEGHPHEREAAFTAAPPLHVTWGYGGQASGERVPAQDARTRPAPGVQIWVPNVRSKGFAQEARHQAATVAQADQQTDDQDFGEAVTAAWDEE